MLNLPDFIEQGEQARLFPVGSLSNKERRTTSTLLAVLPILPELAEQLLQTIGFRLGKKAQISVYTEVVLKNTENKDRPDGLLIIEQGKKTFTALVEAKVDKAHIDGDQLQRYLRIATDNKIDAVITVSNQFVSNPTISPVKNIPKPLLRKVQLFHWSWTFILTQLHLLQSAHAVGDREKLILLEELGRYFTHPSTGIESFTQMSSGWKEIVKTVGAGGRLSVSDKDLQEAVDAWIQEERDLSLLLSRVVKLPVVISLPRKFQTDAEIRRKAVLEELSLENRLSSNFRVPNAADDMSVVVDLARKSMSVCMNLRAPEDKKSTSARVNWLLRMLKSEDARIHVRANWPSRVPYTQENILKIRQNPDILQSDNPKLVPVSFDVLLIEDTGARFSGRKTFIEDLERLVPEFYEIIGQNLRPWQKRPPMIEKRKAELAEPAEVAGESMHPGSDTVVVDHSGAPEVDQPAVQDFIGTEGDLSGMDRRLDTTPQLDLDDA